MRTRLMIAIVEVTGAAILTYQQMAESDKQRVRMLIFQHGAHLCHTIAHRAGTFGILLEHKYHEETIANG